MHAHVALWYGIGQWLKRGRLRAKACGEIQLVNTTQGKMGIVSHVGQMFGLIGFPQTAKSSVFPATSSWRTVLRGQGRSNREIPANRSFLQIGNKQNASHRTLDICRYVNVLAATYGGCIVASRNQGTDTRVSRVLANLQIVQRVMAYICMYVDPNNLQYRGHIGEDLSDTP